MDDRDIETEIVEARRQGDEDHGLRKNAHIGRHRNRVNKINRIAPHIQAISEAPRP